jgi:hypothetical protein
MSSFACPCGCISTEYERDPECILNTPLPVLPADRENIEGIEAAE